MHLLSLPAMSANLIFPLHVSRQKGRFLGGASIYIYIYIFNVFLNDRGEKNDRQLNATETLLTILGDMTSRPTCGET